MKTRRNKKLIATLQGQPQQECQEALTDAFDFIFERWRSQNVDKSTGQNMKTKQRCAYQDP